MIEKPLATLTAADIQRLVDDGASEDRTIEFKRELPGSKDSDRKEFLADVSSFANAVGGDLIYGVAAKDGRAVAADGLLIANLDAELLRLDSIIRSGISPRLVGCQVQPIHGLPKGPAILIRIPRSWQGPHTVSFQQEFRFYSRSTNGRFRMDASDVRDAVLRVGTVEERIRLFRAERLARIMAGETPAPMDGTKLVCLHAVPFYAYSGAPPIDLRQAAQHTSMLRPVFSGSYSAPEFNIDGIYTYVPKGDDSTTHSYVQLLRNGIVEAVESEMIRSPPPHPEAVPSLAFAQELFAFATRVVKLYETLEVSPPVAILVSLLGAKGVHLAISRYVEARLHLRTIDRNMLLLPEVVIDESSFEPPIKLKPILDALWQSVGAPRCFDYDDGGRWNPQK